MSRLEVREAMAEDVGEIVDILSEAARWLLARGIEQWPDPFPRERVEALARRGEFHVASLGGETVAVFALLWNDPTFWGERPDDAGYVHALAVRRAYARMSLGDRLLGWVDAEVIARGRRYLRLDCRADNGALRRYYERLGFEPRGEVEVDDFVAVRFERRCRTAARRPRRPVETSSRTRHRPVTDTRSSRRYARSGSEGGPRTPPRREGVQFVAEGFAAMSAREWREFWQVRGMRELRLVLWASWDPIGGTPPGEYDAYAFRVASLLGSRASREALAEELGRIRRDELGVEPNAEEDVRAAEKMGDWFDHSVGTRDR